MMIRKWFARITGKPGNGLSYEYMYGHYLFAGVKAFWRCRKKLNILDFAQLIILIPFVGCGKEDWFEKFMRNMLLKVNPKWLWTVHWTYQDDFETWAKQNPVIGQYIKKKEENFTRLYEIHRAALTRLTEEQASWLASRLEKERQLRKEAKKEKERKKHVTTYRA